MKLSEIMEELKAEVVVDAGNLDAEIRTACGSDMMSDVLAFAKDQSVFLTGLMNPQVVRTAEMMDMRCVIFVRGKTVDEMQSRWGFRLQPPNVPCLQRVDCYMLRESEERVKDNETIITRIYCAGR